MPNEYNNDSTRLPDDDEPRTDGAPVLPTRPLPLKPLSNNPFRRGWQVLFMKSDDPRLISPSRSANDSMSPRTPSAGLPSNATATSFTSFWWRATTFFGMVILPIILIGGGAVMAYLYQDRYPRLWGFPAVFAIVYLILLLSYRKVVKNRQQRMRYFGAAPTIKLPKQPPHNR